jgi:signal transduction histidine kinase
MRSSTDPRPDARTAAALVSSIEALSLLRALTDRLAAARDFGMACRALVDLVWEERQADAVGFVSVDTTRHLGRVEAVAPGADGNSAEIDLTAAPFPALLTEGEPIVVDAPTWLGASLPGPGVLVGAPMRVQGVVTGLLVAYHVGGTVDVLVEDHRVLALVAASAALPLDAARSQVREEFLSALRHDINNPLHAALGQTEIIIDRLRDGGDRATLTLAGAVVESLRVVADLVSNHLSMAAIDRGLRALDLTVFDLSALAGEVAARFRPEAAERRLTITCDGPEVLVRADRRQLARVITNLVSNAVKYTPGPGSIELTTGSAGGTVTLAVHDTGYGLAPAHLAAVGTKYMRFHRDRAIPGVGLGLYISRAILDAHGGTLRVSSTPGQGSTFTVCLPGA